MSQKDRNWAAIALGIVCLLLTGSIVFQIVINADNQDQDESIRESQYRGCVVNGNALREQVRAEFIDLKRDAIISVYRDFLDQAPPRSQRPPESQEGVQLLRDVITRLRARIQTIDERIPDVDCLRIYPALPGQTYPDIAPPPST